MGRSTTGFVNSSSEVGRIIPIRPGKDLKPLYILPDLGGNLLYARAIAAHLNTDRPLLGLGLPAGITSGVSLETIASGFARLLEMRAQDGPVHLVGHSFAGLLAFAVAVELERRGIRPGFVILIDTSTPPTPATQARSLVYRYIRNALPVSRGDSGNGAQPNILSAPGYATFNLDNQPENQRPIIAALYEAMVQYRPRDYPLSVAVIRANETASFSRKDLGWRRYAHGGVVSLDVPGNHLSVIRDEAYAANVARAIEHLLASDLGGGREPGARPGLSIA